MDRHRQREGRVNEIAREGENEDDREKSVPFRLPKFPYYGGIVDRFSISRS